MLSKKMERCLSFLMAVIMVLSLMPVSALAAEEETHDHTQETVEPAANETQESAAAETTVPAEEPNPVIEEIQFTMDDILAYYLGSADVAAQEVPALCADLDAAALADAKREAIGLEGTLQEYLEEGLLTQAEYDALMAGNPAYVTFAECVTADVSSDSGVSVLADPYVFYPLSEDVTLDTDNRITVSIEGADEGDNAPSGKDGMVQAFVTTVADGSGGYATKTATITITNNTASTLEISFHWATRYVSNLTVDGDPLATNVEGTTEGDTTKMMAGGASIVVKLTSSDKQATASRYRLSGFTAAEPTGAQVTVEDASGKATFDGAAVASGSVVNVPEAGGTLATDATNFVAWINADTGAVLSKTASFTLEAASDMTVKALRNTSAIFGIGTDKLFDDLNTANAVATSGTTIVLTNNGTLPAGNYTIKNGVTLLIPYSSDNVTPMKANPTNVTSYKTPTAFRTLTMASGAKITVESGGSISLDAQHHAGGAGKNAGSPTGPVSFIKMNANSNITVQGGGFLYAWGFITGSGTVTVENNGTVYENFQINDFRGGTHTTWAATMGVWAYKVFLFNSYYVQNIEVPMTLKSGAKEVAYTTIYAKSTAKSTSVTFIGAGGMFNNSSGYVVKTYDGTKDRLVLDIYGNITINPVALSLGGTDVDSRNFVLPLNSNISINLHSGKAEVNQTIAMLPGSEVTIDSGANLVINSGYSLYVYDSAQWRKENCYPQDYVFMPVAYAPGRASGLGGGLSSLPDAKICVNGTLTATAGSIYTTAGGANICSTGNGRVVLTGRKDTTTYQYTGVASSVLSGPGKDKLTVNSAKLLNSDGSYVTTSSASSSAPYEYYNGKWCTHSSGTTTVAGKAATCTATGLTDGEACSTCGKVPTAQEVIPATGHENTTTTTENPTCTEAGSTTVTCDKCGEVISTQEIPATGHTFDTTVEAKDATCQAAGNEAHKQCTVCNLFFAADAGDYAAGGAENADGFVIAQLEHTYTAQSDAADAFVSAANCASPAVYKAMCSVCFDKNTDKTVTVGNKDTNNHVGETEVRNKVDATCQQAGYTGDTYCKSCNEMTKQGSATDMLPHTEVTDAAVAPTCTETGLTEGKHCSVCNEVLVAQTVVDAKGHTPGEDTVNHIVSATADKDSYTVVTACQVCGETADTKTVNTVAFVNINIDGVEKSALFGSLADALAYAAENEIGVVMLQRDVTEPVTVSQTVAVYDNDVTVNGENLVAGNDYTKARREDIDGKANAWIFYPKVEYITYTSSLLTVEGKVSLLMKFYIPTELEDDVIINTIREKCLDTVRNKWIEYSPTNSTVGALRASGMDDKGRYTLIQEFASGEMSSNVSVYFKDGDTELPIYADGKKVADTFKCSIADYSVEALKNGNDKMRYLSQTMLTFGAYAKEYFGVQYSENTGKKDLDSIVSDAVTMGYVTALDLDAFSEVWNAANNSYKASVSDTFAKAPIETATIRQSLILDSDTTIRVFFNAADVENLSEYTFTLFYPANNTTSQMTVEPELQSDGRYMIAIESIPVAYWDSECKILVTRKGDTAEPAAEKLEISIYVLTWAKSCINSQSATEEQKNMAKAMFLYNDAANKYFAR